MTKDLAITPIEGNPSSQLHIRHAGPLANRRNEASESMQAGLNVKLPSTKMAVEPLAGEGDRQPVPLANSNNEVGESTQINPEQGHPFTQALVETMIPEEDHPPVPPADNITEASSEPHQQGT